MATRAAAVLLFSVGVGGSLVAPASAEHDGSVCLGNDFTEPIPDAHSSQQCDNMNEAQFSGTQWSWTPAPPPTTTTVPPTTTTVPPTTTTEPPPTTTTVPPTTTTTPPPTTTTTAPPADVCSWEWGGVVEAEPAACTVPTRSSLWDTETTTMALAFLGITGGLFVGKTVIRPTERWLK